MNIFTSLIQLLFSVSLFPLSVTPTPVTSIYQLPPLASHFLRPVTSLCQSLFFISHYQSFTCVSHFPRSVTSLCQSLPSVIHFPSQPLFSHSLSPLSATSFDPSLLSVALPSVSQFPPLCHSLPPASLSSLPVTSLCQ